MDIAVDHLEVQASQPETGVVAEELDNSNNSALQIIETRQKAKADWLKINTPSDIDNCNFNFAHLNNEVNFNNNLYDETIGLAPLIN